MRYILQYNLTCTDITDTITCKHTHTCPTDNCQVKHVTSLMKSDSSVTKSARGSYPILENHHQFVHQANKLHNLPSWFSTREHWYLRRFVHIWAQGEHLPPRHSIRMIENWCQVQLHALNWLRYLCLSQRQPTPHPPPKPLGSIKMQRTKTVELPTSCSQFLTLVPTHHDQTSHCDHPTPKQPQAPKSGTNFIKGMPH